MSFRNLPYYCTECGKDFKNQEDIWSHDCDKNLSKKDAIKFGQDIGVAVGLGG